MKPFQLWKNEKSNTKIALFEIDLPESIPFWLNESPGIYKYTYRNFRQNTSLAFQQGSFCFGNFEGNGTANTGTNNTPRLIGSFSVNGENYIRCSSLALCKRTNYSFFFDTDTSILYVNFFDVLPWTTRSIKAGVTRGFCKGASDLGIYLDNIYYEPRIKSFPQITVEADDLFYGIRKYSFGSVVLFNEDGSLDDFDDETVFGQECRAKVGGKLADGTALDIIDYKQVFTGYIQKIDTSTTECTIDLGDKKDKIGRSLPVNFFSSTDYPNIKSGDDGKGIPLRWGDCSKVNCVCVNEEATPAPANYQFVIADISIHSISSLNAVYIDGVEETPTPTLVNDTTNDIAYFNIASGGNYEPGNTVTCDLTGFDDSADRDASGSVIEDGLDVIEDIFYDYLNISYNQDTFEKTEWEALKANDYDQGISVEKDTKISQIIEKICVGHLAVFFLTGENKWIMRKIDDSARIQILIELDEIFNEPKKRKDGKKYLSSAIVKYDKDHAKNEYKEYTDDSEEVTTFDTYGIRRAKDFETYLVNAADAQEIAAEMVTEYQTIPSEFTVLTSMRACDLWLFDIVVIEFNRKELTWLGYVKCRVMGIKYILNNPMGIELTLRYIEDDTNDIVIDMLLIEKIQDQDYDLSIGKISDNTHTLQISKWR